MSDVINRYEAFRVHEEQEMAYCCFGTGPRINSSFGWIGSWNLAYFNTGGAFGYTPESRTQPKWCRAWCFISVLANLAYLINWLEDMSVLGFQNPSWRRRFRGVVLHRQHNCLCAYHRDDATYHSYNHVTSLVK